MIRHIFNFVPIVKSTNWKLWGIVTKMCNKKLFLLRPYTVATKKSYTKSLMQHSAFLLSTLSYNGGLRCRRTRGNIKPSFDVSFWFFNINKKNNTQFTTNHFVKAQSTTSCEIKMNIFICDLLLLFLYCNWCMHHSLDITKMDAIKKSLCSLACIHPNLYNFQSI